MGGWVEWDCEAGGIGDEDCGVVERSGSGSSDEGYESEGRAVGGLWEVGWVGRC